MAGWERNDCMLFHRVDLLCAKTKNLYNNTLHFLLPFTVWVAGVMARVSGKLCHLRWDIPNTSNAINLISGMLKLLSRSLFYAWRVRTKSRKFFWLNYKLADKSWSTGGRCPCAKRRGTRQNFCCSSFFFSQTWVMNTHCKWRCSFSTKEHGQAMCMIQHATDMASDIRKTWFSSAACRGTNGCSL